MGDARQHRGARAQLRRRRKKSEGYPDLGRSRGGFSTKLHGLADGLGNPLRFALTAGQAGDAPVALPLLGTVEILAVEAVLADRADDSDVLLVWIVSQGAVPVIPPHPGRSAPRPTDWHLYKERARIECLFGKLEHFRRVFSRFDELVRRYLAFVHLAAVCILLR